MSLDRAEKVILRLVGTALACLIVARWIKEPFDD